MVIKLYMLKVYTHKLKFKSYCIHNHAIFERTRVTILHDELTLKQQMMLPFFQRCVGCDHLA